MAEETCKEERKGQSGSLEIAVEPPPIMKLLGEWGGKLAEYRQREWKCVYLRKQPTLHFIGLPSWTPIG
jgi:hypothetical protein